MKLALGNPNWFELQLDRQHFSVVIRRQASPSTATRPKKEELLVPLNYAILLRGLLRRHRRASESRNRLNIHHDLE